MLTRKALFSTAAGLLLAVLASPSNGGDPAGHAFTYQGMLRDGGLPVDGTADFNCRLYGVETGGTQIAVDQVDGAVVIGGVFTVDLDFNADPFTADQALWLEIDVRTPAGAGAFTTLAPRQRIAPTPRSLSTRGIEVDASGQVGIGTESPIRRLHVAGDQYLSGGLSFFDQWDLSNFPDAFFINETDVAARLTVLAGGNVGIGTMDPIERLHVAGNLFMTGDSVQMFDWDINTGTKFRINETNVASRMVIEPGGKVGIGVEDVPSSFFFQVSSSQDKGFQIMDFPGPLTASFTNEAGEGCGVRLAGLPGPDFWAINQQADGHFGIVPGPGLPATAGLHVFTDSSTGIGTNAPSFTLEVDGTAGKPGGGSWSVSSDVRLKKNVRDLDGALETLLALRGVTFEYKDPASINELPGRRVGFVAQEVEQVIPDWVSERADGYKAVGVRGFEAMAVEAMRELDAENQTLRSELGELREQLETLQAAVEASARR